MGLLKKIEEFNILTGSSSIFISSGYNAFKTKVISYAHKKSKMEDLMPQIQDIVYPPILEIYDDNVERVSVLRSSKCHEFKSVGCACNLVIDKKAVPRYASDLILTASIARGDTILFGKKPLVSSDSFTRE